MLLEEPPSASVPLCAWRNFSDDPYLAPFARGYLLHHKRFLTAHAAASPPFRTRHVRR